MQQKTRTADFVLVGMFAALMAIGANITSIVPFLQVGGIPITMQPFLCTCWSFAWQTAWRISDDCVCLGWNCWCTCIRTVLSGLWGYFRQKRWFCIIVYSCCLASWIHFRKRKNPGFSTFLLAAIAGTTVMYVIGTTYTYLALNVWLNAPISYQTTWFFMIWFMVKDYALTILLAMLAPKIYRSVSKATSFRKQQAAS